MKLKLANWEKFKIDLPHRKLPYSKRNWGNGIHSLCSYQGKMKPSLVRCLLDSLSDENETIFDPFCGSGTTLLESALSNRKSLGFDISVIATAISHAKINLIDKNKVENILDELEKYILSSKVSLKTIKDSEEVHFNKSLKEYYHKQTFNEILLARDYFSEKLILSNPEFCFVFSSLLHILHGNRPYALSRRSHPLTPYAPTGDFIHKNLIQYLRKKIDISYKHMEQIDYKNYKKGKAYQFNILDNWKIKSNSVDLILTSPPFAFSTKFYINNWIRYWFSGWGINDFETESEKFVEKKQKQTMDIYDHIFNQSKKILSKSGLIVFHLGLNDRMNMGEELKNISKKYFNVHDLFNETVEHCEKHGIRDKGGIKEHQYLILKH